MSRPRRFDLIAFDWDGTLFDSTAIIVRCIQRAVADVGGTVPSDRDAAYVIGMGLMQALAHAAPDVPQDIPFLVRGEVGCPADFNVDMSVDIFDYLDFLDAFISNDALADVNHDSVVDLFDYLDFVDTLSRGC